MEATKLQRINKQRQQGRYLSTWIALIVFGLLFTFAVCIAHGQSDTTLIAQVRQVGEPFAMRDIKVKPSTAKSEPTENGKTVIFVSFYVDSTMVNTNPYVIFRQLNK